MESSIADPTANGVRSPIADSTANGVMYGLTLDTSESELALLYYATVQGIAYGPRHIVEHCNAHGHKVLDDIFENRASPAIVSRMSISINAQNLPSYALNDLLIAHPSPAAVSRFSFRYHAHIYNNGTTCDLTNQPRETEISYVYGKGEFERPSSCARQKTTQLANENSDCYRCCKCSGVPSFLLCPSFLSQRYQVQRHPTG
ncbi:hypothetical protein Droror1_Dr00023736 [Drosera rotundifolia]